MVVDLDAAGSTHRRRRQQALEGMGGGALIEGGGVNEM
jgi:hypothetical protein